MNRQQILDYYSRKDIAEEIARYSKDREVAGAYPDGTYAARPNIIQYSDDVVQMAKKGISSFHLSVERWSNPMGITPENHEKLRKGWDFIIDIDSKIGIDGSKTAALLICEFMEKYGIRNYGIKFSGRRGFHIALSSDAFPAELDYKKISSFYPKVPRIIARFIRNGIADELMPSLLKIKPAKELIELLGELPDKMDPFYFVEVEKDWGARHMFRAPYSLNEKTWLVSVPIRYGQLKNFSADMAEPDKVKTGNEFLISEKNEAEELLSAAMDWYASKKTTAIKKSKKKFVIEKRIGEEYFPPCIKAILLGLHDGKKRSIFTLINFLRMMNWSWDEIENKLYEWNEKNSPQLHRSAILGQLRWNQSQQRQLNPANCDNGMFYRDIGICQPDRTCKNNTSEITIKNPISYPFRIAENRERRIRGFSCGICNREFPTTKKLKYHMSRAH
ncbi:MAG: hypothetical protein HZB67_03475 [Candidatus Aenigmarchaeota archaeon]|nr:hypothetical protein [Candidatus Aenigmarchaeota archaeon]